MALWLEYSCVGGTDRTTTNAPKCDGVEPPSGPPPTNCKGGNREQLDVRGCGGWINLECRGGCLNIRKVRQRQHANLFQDKFHDKGKYGTIGLVFPSHTIYKGVKIFRPRPPPSLSLGTLHENLFMTCCLIGKPLFEMCWFCMGVAQIALDPPSLKRANVEKSVPNHPSKPQHPPFLRAMPIWKQHISKRGFP